MAQGENIVELQEFRSEPAIPAKGRVTSRGGKELAAGTTLLHGQYTLTGYLNSGGFGITYRAIDSLGRGVVVKECFPTDLCLRSGLDVLVRDPAHSRDLASVIGQFVAEARSLARLKHRGIVEVHQVFMENETAYFAMDFIDGPDLLAVIEDGKSPLQPRDIEAISRKLLRAVGYVHDRGLLHRDIAPDNILIDRGGEPKLIDFGAARGHDVSHDETPWQLKFVKDGYSPDEFYDPARPHGVPSDLYSLGATLHHVVAGAAPIDAEMRRRAIEQGQGDPYEPLAGRFQGFTPGFLAAIDMALAFAPDDRHASARDWVKSIGRAAAAAPAEATKIETLYVEKVDAPAPEAEEAKERDLMPWVGGLAAAVGVGIAVFASQDGGASSSPVATLGAGPEPAAVAPIAASDVVVPPELSQFAAVAAPGFVVVPSGADTPVATPDGSTRPPTFDVSPGTLNMSEDPAPEISTLASVASQDRPAVTLPTVVADRAFFGDVSLASVPVGKIEPVWMLHLPFTTTPERIRNADVAIIDEVDADLDRALSGDWIAPGLTIFAVNGEALRPGMSFETHLTQGIRPDPDGHARATILYRVPGEDGFDRGLLTFRAAKTVTMPDGTVLVTSEAQSGRVSVKLVGESADTTVQKGDLLPDAATLASFSDAANAAVAANADFIDFDVLREGAATAARLSLRP